MASTVAAIAPVAVRPMASTPLKQAKNTFAARTVSNGSIKKVSAMQGKQCGSQRGASALSSPCIRIALQQPRLVPR